MIRFVKRGLKAYFLNTVFTCTGNGHCKVLTLYLTRSLYEEKGY